MYPFYQFYISKICKLVSSERVKQDDHKREQSDKSITPLPVMIKSTAKPGIKTVKQNNVGNFGTFMQIRN